MKILLPNRPCHCLPRNSSKGNCYLYSRHCSLAMSTLAQMRGWWCVSGVEHLLSMCDVWVHYGEGVGKILRTRGLRHLPPGCLLYATLNEHVCVLTYWDHTVALYTHSRVFISNFHRCKWPTMQIQLGRAPWASSIHRPADCTGISASGQALNTHPKH